MALLRTLLQAGIALGRRMERLVDGWLPGLAARFVFASVLFLYYWNSALTKIGDGLFGIFQISDGAYAQIVPPVLEAADYDSSAIAFLPWGLIVMLGTYAEFILPVLIVIGLFTRLAAMGMIVFVIVQSYVDIAFHGVDAQTIGSLFDRSPSSTILDQRTLWTFLLLILVIKGAGSLSLDALIRRRVASATPASGV